MSLSGAARRTVQGLRWLWGFLREASGDGAYDAYLRRAGAGPRLTRQEFYLDGLRRRYGQASRCC